MKYLVLSFSICGLLLCAVGCQFGSSEYGHVTGVVQINGQPVEKAVVTFVPVEGGRAAMAITQADGSYELNYTPGVKGAKLGDNRVQLSTYIEPSINDNRVVDKGTPERFPPKFSGGEEVVVTVKSGNNVFDFDAEADRDDYSKRR